MGKQDSSGQHRGKQGKTREFGAGKSDRTAAARRRQEDIRDERGQRDRSGKKPKRDGG